jgi:hypothetical protein
MSLCEVFFEEDSSLTRIERWAFSDSSVESIRIPVVTEVDGDLGCKVMRIGVGEE